jgi:S1-C subfamily serine protease
MSGGRNDVAVLTLDLKELPTAVPVLPLETEEDVVAVGTTVVMMGYPLGPDRLLALMDDAESRSIQQRYGTLDALLGYFAESRRIQPQITQGNITDVNKGRIAYDARTAEGGSGAPVFGQLGHVIGVNFAISTESQASNFAVPIQYGIELLQRAGWKYAPPTENKETENAPPPPK